MHRIFSALLVLAACAPSAQPGPTAPGPASPEPGGSTVAPAPGSPPPCTAGQAWYTPAGDETRITGACYTPCDTTCPIGQVCTDVLTNPCGANEQGQVRTCMAASTQSRLCLAG